MGTKKTLITFLIVAVAAGSSRSFATTPEHAVSKQSTGVAGQALSLFTVGRPSPAELVRCRTRHHLNSVARSACRSAT
jgi:hypothetical protein